MIARIDAAEIRHLTSIPDRFAVERRIAAVDCRKSFPLSSVSLHELLLKIHLCGCSGRPRLNFIQALLAMQVSRLYLGLGFSTIALYVEKNFGCKPFQTYDYLKIARALNYLPLCCAAYIDGTIAWPELRLLAGVSAGETEKTWLEFAATHSLADLEEKIRETFNRTRQAGGPVPFYQSGSPFLEPPPALYA